MTVSVGCVSVRVQGYEVECEGEYEVECEGVKRVCECKWRVSVMCEGVRA